MTGVQTCALPIFDFSIGTEFLSLEQRGDKVFVRARRSDTDEVETIEADYVVGADGARSKVRDAIGATMVGTRSRTGYYNFIIHAHGLHPAPYHGPGVVYWQKIDRASCRERVCQTGEI